MKTNDCLQIVVMGISSTGKTVVARRLAEEFGLRFAEGDDFHSQRSVDKMAAGIPLTDEDRWPWLETLADLIARSHASHESSVLTCSALRRGYRDILRSKAPAHSVFFIHLGAGFDLIHDRMTHRSAHFMPPSLLQSQIDTLEPLDPDEDGAVVDSSPPLDAVVEQAAKVIRSYVDGTDGAPRLCRQADTQAE